MKVLVDIPDELYDTIRNKTLYLTSNARSNGKHLVYELIGCIMNGEIITDIQNSNNVVHQADELTFITGLSTDTDKPVPESKTWNDCSTCEHEIERDGSNCYECIKGIKNHYSPKEAIENKYGEKNLIKGDCKHCSDHVDYMIWGEDTLYACRLRKCKFEESE